jgi:N-acyl-D-amino-acid deacylase
MPTVDVLIANGRICDGTGDPWTYGDVLLQGDRILEVAPPGTVSPGRAGEVVDASELVVCPGFIDIQSHSILPLMVDGRSVSKLLQGVTTEVMGEGWTPGPTGGRLERVLPRHPYGELLREWEELARRWHGFADWLEALADRGVSPNVASFVAGGTLREHVMGMETAPADEERLRAMVRLADDAMREGAMGVAYALIYPPDAFCTTDEIVAVCRAVAARGGLYVTHIRSEGDRLLEAVEEAIEIGRQARCPVEIYHLKASGRRNWGAMPAVIERIEEARAAGCDVTAGMYPYAAAGTGLASVLPPWLASGGLYRNLRDPALRARAREAALHPDGSWEALADLAGPDGVMPIGFQLPDHRHLVGKRLSEIAAERGQDWFEAACDLLAAEEQSISTIYFVMSEDNLERQLRLPWVKVSTDAGGFDPSWAEAFGPVHPRAYGTYPRVLGHYVRERSVIGLEEAIRKMSGAVAHRLGLSDRGLIRAAQRADLVLIDPERVADVATFEQPHRFAVGVRDVWVNGVRVVAGGAHTGARPGRVLWGPGR